MAHQNWQRNVIRNYLWKKSRIGRSKAKKILRKTFPPIQTVDLDAGLLMKLDVSKSNQDFVFWFYEEIEPSLQWAINNLFPVVGTFVDCGANTGIFGLLALHKRSASFSLFLEPVQRLCDSIVENIALNKFDSHSEILELAASDTEGESELHLHDTSNDGRHSLENNGAEDGFHETCTVKTRRLENIFNERQFKKIDFLKIDTESHDLHVLQGLGNYLDPDTIPLIYVEMGGKEIADLMTSCGYTAFASEKLYIDDLRKKLRAESKGKSVAYFHPVDDLNSVNYLWCKKNSPTDLHLRKLSQAAC